MTEREQFEARAKKAGWPHHFTSCNTKDPNAYSQESWEAWQARAQPAQAAPITSESGNQAAQGASGITSGAVPVLTHRETLEEWTNTTLEPCTHQEAFVRGARWAEQAVLAKLGVAQTCEWTLQDDDTGAWASACGELWQFSDGGPPENNVRYCHGCGGKVGIVGKEGGNV